MISIITYETKQKNSFIFQLHLVRSRYSAPGGQPDRFTTWTEVLGDSWRGFLPAVVARSSPGAGWPTQQLSCDEWQLFTTLWIAERGGGDGGMGGMGEGWVFDLIICLEPQSRMAENIFRLVYFLTPEPKKEAMTTLHTYCTYTLWKALTHIFLCPFKYTVL